MTLTLGSLFDGSGGFPLAGSLRSIEPIWASEVEPYPIAVTCSRFPLMEHLGSVTDINGTEVEPVDVLTFGSPCQDLSVAGKRAGLKHEDNGDDETTRSGLFMEAIRIIKEMREATNGNYPKWAVWENVPGAFSSNKGEDFRTVLEELIKTVEPTAVMPPVPKNGWPYADCYYGDGWSIAYRVLDAQYIRTAQRRRRIYLVLHLTGQRAGSVLFEREGLRGNTPQSGTPRKRTAGDAENCTGTTDREGIINLNKGDVQSKAILDPRGIAPALYAGECRYGGGEVYVLDRAKPLAFHLLQDPISVEDKTPCLSTGSSDHGQASIGAVIPIHDKATRYQGGGPTRNGDGAGNGLGVGQPGGPAPTLSTCDRHAVCYTTQAFGNYKDCGIASGLKARDYKDATDLVVERESPIQYIVRRLTPTECARLQGFPDEWGHPIRMDSITDGDYRFWLEVRKTHAAINGKSVKDFTEQQIMTWYNKLHTDSAEYKMWGNGIALPCALYVMEGLVDASKPIGGDADEVQPKTSPSHS